MLTITVVEAVGHVTRHLDVLNLVAPNGYLVRVEHQDVGAHEYRVHEQTSGDVGIGICRSSHVFIDSRLVRMGSVEHTLAGDTRQKPGQLGNLGDVGLPVERDALGVQPRSQPAGSNLQRGTLDATGFFHLDQRVVVRQKIEALNIGAQACAH